MAESRLLFLSCLYSESVHHCPDRPDILNRDIHRFRRLCSIAWPASCMREEQSEQVSWVIHPSRLEQTVRAQAREMTGFKCIGDWAASSSQPRSTWTQVLLVYSSSLCIGSCPMLSSLHGRLRSSSTTVLILVESFSQLDLLTD